MTEAKISLRIELWNSGYDFGVSLWINNKIPLTWTLSPNNSYFLEGVKCVEEFLDTVPCIRNQRATLMDMFRSGSDNLIETMCGEYSPETDACERLGPAPKPAKEITKQYITPMSLFIDLLESVKSFSAPFPGAQK